VRSSWRVSSSARRRSEARWKQDAQSGKRCRTRLQHQEQQLQARRSSSCEMKTRAEQELRRLKSELESQFVFLSRALSRNLARIGTQFRLQSRNSARPAVFISARRTSPGPAIVAPDVGAGFGTRFRLRVCFQRASTSATRASNDAPARLTATASCSILFLMLRQTADAARDNSAPLFRQVPKLLFRWRRFS